MKLLDKIKDEYAKELHCEDWIELLMEITIMQEELDVHDEIAKRYAKAILERAAENAKIKVMDETGFSYTTDYDVFKNIIVEIDKQSILNTDLG